MGLLARGPIPLGLLLALYLFFLFFLLSKGGVKKLRLVLLGVGPFLAIYLLNHDNRIYSHHGFMHAGVVYQILNGDIPPQNPLLTGQPLLYHWGYHYLIARVTGILNLSPFSSAALINLVSLCAVMVLIYKISGLLIKDERANVLSVCVSLFGVTVFNAHALHLLPSGVFMVNDMIRASAAIRKFSNMNAVPVGLAFFLLYLYSTIRFFGSKKINVCLALFLISVLGCGFFCPVFLPVLAAAGFLSCLIVLLPGDERIFLKRLAKAGMLIATAAIGALILSPYLHSISAGVRQQLNFFNPEFVFKRVLSALFLGMPILIIVYAGRKSLKERLNKQASLVLLAVIVAAISLYVTVNLPAQKNEYKFLYIFGVGLGIFGGIGFDAMFKWRHRTFAGVLLFLFFFCGGESVAHKLRLKNSVYSFCIEKGRYLYAVDTRENELYQWIRQNTPKDGIFVDSRPLMPIFAQRPLWIGTGEETAERRQYLLGYGISIDVLLKFSGYEPGLIRKRRKLVNDIYATSQRLPLGEIKDLYSYDKPVYVVARNKETKDKLKDSHLFNEVFSTLDERVSVYQLSTQGNGILRGLERH